MSWLTAPGPKAATRTALIAIGGAAALVLAVLVLHQLPASTSLTGKFQTPFPVAVLGVIQGMTYGLLAVGLVLIYRTNRVINFAHGELGAFAAAFFGVAVLRWHIPYWTALPIALCVGGGAGAAAEVGAIRRLRNAPRLMSMVATLGIVQFLALFAAAFNSTAGAGALFPQPSGLPTFTIGQLVITPAYCGMLILSPLAACGLALFLRRSRYGLALRSAAANPDAARLSGIFAARTSSLAWALASGLSALSAILTQPTLGFTSSSSFGPTLLLRALTAAALARMESLPLAFVAGIGVGVVEQILLWNYPDSGLVEMVLFVVVVLALLLLRGRTGRTADRTGSWAAVQALRPLPAALREVWLVRHLGQLVAGVALVVALLLPLLITNGAAITLTGVIGFAIVGSSVGLLVGSSGQLTLGQFAVAAMGAVASAKFATSTGNYLLAFGAAAAVGAVVCLMLGLPALRSQGLLLTVVTLSFAIVTPDWLLPRSSLLGAQGLDPGRPVIFGHPFLSGHSYYLFALAVLVITLLLVANVRRSGFGRQMNAVRDNEDNARAFALSAVRVKASGYLVAGALAGIGGATYGHALTSIDASTFPASASIDVVVMTVIGGVSLLSGPLLGALFVIAVPAFVPLDSAGLAATALGQLIVILYLPRGIGQIVEPLRDALARRLAGALPKPPAAGTLPTHVGAVTASSVAIGDPPDRHVVLAAEDLHKSFGGLVAVDGMSLRLYAGETIGLIGPNGAGKTTTFELLSGFVGADSGRVLLSGRDITRLSPERRARAGLVRSFQDAALFPTITVEDTLLLSLERESPTRAWRGVLGFPDNNRARRRRAEELIEMLRLGDYRDRQIRELSTGTRRITELACMIGMQPKVLLLDEPSSGIAQRETEALGALLVDVRRELDAAMIVIEHDIPLIMSISDRVIAMSAGRLIAEGSPEVIRTDEAVVHSYLGMDRVAIERSGATASQ